MWITWIQRYRFDEALTDRGPPPRGALEQRIRDDGLGCDPEFRFLEDAVSGTLLLRPGLERLRDQAAAGTIDRLYVLDPDRFSRKYAYLR
jgi:site-specific DNA recombinase